MKKIFLLSALAIMLAAPAVPGRAAGSCCIEKQPNSDVVLSCSPLSGATCLAPSIGIDCALEPKCSAFATPNTPAVTPPAQPGTKAEFPILVPKIPLNIPTVSLQDFTNVTQADGFLYIPFISVFLVGAYKLGVGIAAILAVIMIMVGGFIWIASAGDSGKISQAKKMIAGAVIGLVLTVGSYTLLQIINPNLVNFTALKIPIVAPRTIEIIDDFNPEVDNPGGGGVNTSTPSQYDDIFKKYAPCAGVTPEVLKAIAQAESGLNASKVNKSGYIGLFQTKQANCPAVVANYCTDLTNPDNNTAAGAAMIKKSADLISNKCPKASPHDQMVMIYIGHNMGAGMLQYVTNKGCDVPAMRQAAIDYYTANPKTAESYSKKYQQGCLDSGKTAAQCTGGPKFDYAEAIAKKSDGQISQVLATTTTGKCPY